MRKLFLYMVVFMLSLCLSEFAYAWGDGWGNAYSSTSSSTQEISGSSSSLQSSSTSSTIYSDPASFVKQHSDASTLSSLELKTGAAISDGYSYDLYNAGTQVGTYTVKYARDVGNNILYMNLRFFPSSTSDGVVSQFNETGTSILVGQSVNYLSPSTEDISKLSQARTLAENLIKLDMQIMSKTEGSKITAQALQAFCDGAYGKEEQYVTLYSENKDAVITELKEQNIAYTEGKTGIEVSVNAQTVLYLTKLALGETKNSEYITSIGGTINLQLY